MWVRENKKRKRKKEKKKGKNQPGTCDLFLRALIMEDSSSGRTKNRMLEEVTLILSSRPDKQKIEECLDGRLSVRRKSGSESFSRVSSLLYSVAILTRCPDFLVVNHATNEFVIGNTDA